MTALYKAVRPDGTAFYDPSFRWLRKDGKPYARPVRHPDPDLHSDYATYYLSVSTEPAGCTGMRWPCRLLTVEPVGDTRPDGRLRHKVRGAAFLVTGEVEAWRALGPNGRNVAALIDRVRAMTADEARAAWAARLAAYDAAYDAARNAAHGAARDAVLGAVPGGARDAVVPGAARVAAYGEVVADLITVEQYRTLTAPLYDVIGTDWKVTP